MIIFSIDPGIEKVGYSYIKFNPPNYQFISSGLIKTDKNLPLEKRLKLIYDKINDLFDKTKPDIIIVEKVFFFKNQKTAICVSQSQGIILLLAGQRNIPIEFFTPLQIKQTITGYGLADKKSIRKMLTIILKDEKLTSQDDELDAIAGGLTYCFVNRNQLINKY